MLFDETRKVEFRGKAEVGGYLLDAFSRIIQKPQCAGEQLTHQILLWGDMKHSMENPGEMRFRPPHFRSHFRNTDTTVQILADILEKTLKLHRPL